MSHAACRMSHRESTCDVNCPGVCAARVLGVIFIDTSQLTSLVEVYRFDQFLNIKIDKLTIPMQHV